MIMDRIGYIIKRIELGGQDALLMEGEGMESKSFIAAHKICHDFILYKTCGNLGFGTKFPYAPFLGH